MSIVAPYQATVPIGQVQKDGKVLGSEYFIRYVNQVIADRIGGVSGMSNTDLEGAIDAQVAAALTQQGNPQAQQNTLQIDQILSELASVRSDCDQLRQMLAERDSELLGMRVMTDLRARVEQLEDRSL